MALDGPHEMWEVLLEEHHALTQQKARPAFPDIDELKAEIKKKAAAFTEVDRAAVCLSEVYCLIHADAKARGDLPEMGKIALCLSGGGIRSATFNLGLLKGLAKRQKLEKLDYLSTVSGGGFVGSWFSAWAHRTPNGTSAVQEMLEHGCPAELDGSGSPRAAHLRGRVDLADEAPEIEHLREFSNYLTPKLGFLSSDTWALLATYPRNLLLNWLVIIPVILSVILLVWAYFLSGFALNDWNVNGNIPLAYKIVRWGGQCLFLLGIAAAIALAPRCDADEMTEQATSDDRRKLLIWAGYITYCPLVAGILLLNLATPGLIRIYTNSPGASSLPFFALLTSTLRPTLEVTLATNIALAAAAIFIRKMLRARTDRTAARMFWDFVALCFTINLCSLAPVVTILTLLTICTRYQSPEYYLYIFWLSPMARVGVLFLWFTLIVGLLGEKPSPDYENGREWWARLTGMLFRFGTVYVALFAAILVLPNWLDSWLSNHFARAGIVGSSGIVAAIVSAIYAVKVGQFTSNVGSIRNINPELYRLPRRHLPGIAACLFLAIGLIGLSCAVRYFMLPYHSERAFAKVFLPFDASWFRATQTFGVAVGLFVIALLLSWPINVNRFSLGGTFRSRLIRAYLGASRAKLREPDPFTGFDARDNLPLHFLRRNSQFAKCDIEFSQTATMLCTETGGFFDRARERAPLKDSAQFERLKSYLKEPPEHKEIIEVEILGILNDLLRDRDLFTRTYKGINPDTIHPDIVAADEQVDADGSVRIRNRLIIEEQMNQGQKMVVRSYIPRPIHVINSTLNLVGGERLAWQQRKAKSFVFTPLYCGFDRGYRPTALFANGLTLGGAMTVSGAAASPNMGYHSSPLLTMLMMLFNVRLGAWYGNPAYVGSAGVIGAVRDWMVHFPLTKLWPTWRLAAPRFSFRSYIDEAFGRTNQNNPYVYLSDGGHFDNLGLYEMIRRRCHFIVVSDASADSDRKFTDFGNAIQKVRIDMGVTITIDNDYAGFLHPVEETKVHYRVVCCTVHYSDVDCKNVHGEEVDKSAINGRLIYLKPTINANEPPDVYTYGRESPTFPHETTANQWFSEAQFECYRLLGELMADEIPWRDPDGPPPPPVTNGNPATSRQTEMSSEDVP